MPVLPREKREKAEEGRRINKALPSLLASSGGGRDRLEEEGEAVGEKVKLPRPPPCVLLPAEEIK